MIEALSLRLCDGLFKDEETQRDVVVDSVERNMKHTLRNKTKDNFKFTGGCLIWMDLVQQNGIKHI